jgi:hypothetical protein
MAHAGPLQYNMLHGAQLQYIIHAYVTQIQHLASVVLLPRVAGTVTLTVSASSLLLPLIVH